MENLALQIRNAMALDVPKFKNYDKIAICGMGGSGISGYVLKDLFEEKPVFVFQSYDIPKFVNRNTLVFISSYSGNTAETISMYRQAKKKTRNIMIITSGGVLGNEKNVVKIPSTMHPREAIGYLFFPMWKALGKKIGNVIDIVENVDGDWGMANILHNKLAVIYSSSGYYSVALRWKEQINEDSKRLAVANSFPELNHNEVEARFDKAQIVFLKAKDELAIELLKKEHKIIEVELKGKTKLEKIFYGIALGNFVSVHLAELNGEDYLKYRFIEKLKEEMSKRK